MKIAVLVKQVVDVSFPFDLDANFAIMPDDIFYTINPADRSAVEVALKIRDTLGAEVIFISVGPDRVRQVLRACMAMGGDKAVQVWDNTLNDDTDITALLLMKAIALLGPDLILCGGQSFDERCAEIPGILAELLDLPQGTSTTAIELSTDKKTAIIERKLERGRRQRVVCPLPCVIAVEAGISTPRHATLAGMINAHAAVIDHLDLAVLGVEMSQLEDTLVQRSLVSRALPRPRPKKVFTMDAVLSAEARMEMLMSGGLKKSQSNLWEGKAGDLAKKLVEVLLSNKVKVI